MEPAQRKATPRPLPATDPVRARYIQRLHSQRAMVQKAPTQDEPGWEGAQARADAAKSVGLQHVPIHNYEQAEGEAVRRARERARAEGSRSFHLYGTWTQHMGTLGRVKDNLDQIVMERGERMTDETGTAHPYQDEWDARYGKGASGNYVSGSGGGGRDDERAV